MRNVFRAAYFLSLYVATEPYAFVTTPSVSARSLKLRPSFVQKPLCESTVSRLTPRITAFAFSYFAMSRWKLWASTVQPDVKSFG